MRAANLPQPSSALFSLRFRYTQQSVLLIRLLFGPVTARLRGGGWHDMRDPGVVHLLIKSRQIIFGNLLHLRGSLTDQRRHFRQFTFFLAARSGAETIRVLARILHV